MNYSLYAESTPNPEVMKFVSNRMIADKNVELLSAESAKNITIARELFNFPFVKSVFLSSNFISITKTENIKWENIAMQLRIFILDFLNKSKTVINYTENIDETTTSTSSNNKSVLKKEFEGDAKEIEQILEEYIKPAVESDGGSITLDSFENGIVTVNLSGACSGCPSSTITLKQGIESLLKQKLGDKVQEVIANDA
ncbi:MAG: NifU family protein [Flavobacteriales bacterium]|nr:NifU family protein [Flavobacteriales bacterium]MBT6013867.1 NifU family protein [Flavobacteriales bacterium]MBT7481224.1 NifU family protein [Flavobacteriales bacterium]